MTGPTVEERVSHPASSFSSCCEVTFTLLLDLQFLFVLLFLFLIIITSSVIAFFDFLFTSGTLAVQN